MTNQGLKIVCECGRMLAVKENQWLKIEGKTKFKSDGKNSYVTCTKCKKETKVN